MAGLTGPKAPLTYPYPIRQPFQTKQNKDNNHHEVLMDLYQASTQPYQYLNVTGAVNGANKVFTIPAPGVHFVTVFADGKFLHPGPDYTLTYMSNLITKVTTTNAPATALSIIGM